MPKATSTISQSRRKTTSKANNAPYRKKPIPRNSVLSNIPRMSSQGLNFLKCAFAPPDFAMDPGMGIPDEFDGKTLMRKDQLSSTISMTAGTDIFILTVPVPGVSYYSCSVPTGTFPTSTTNWQPTYYSGYQSGLMGNNANAWTGDNVTSFRYASSCAGVYPTSSVMNSSGAIQVWKAPLKLVVAENISIGVATNLQYTVTGLESVASVGPENYSGKFLDGCYTVATSNQPHFEFQPLISQLTTLPSSNIAASNLEQFGYLVGAIGGIGTLDTTVIRLTAPASSVNSFVLKTWNCIEYTVNPSSAMYMYASISAPYDPVALAYYHKVRKELPIAVIAAMNAGFWDRVRSIMSTISKGLSFVPGPVGMIAKGVNALIA